jgi:dTDP-4-amino-4,6-dideoxygalactose transaminase
LIPLVDLHAQYERIGSEVDAAIKRVLERADFILGEDVDAFEAEFAGYCEARAAVGLDSGISALELGMRALDIGPGDEVITPVNSFIASSSAVSFTGATPVWVDVDRETHNIDPELVEAAITPRTRAIMVVHLYGQPVDLDPLLEIAERRGLTLIEDACQAHGARYKGRRVGSFGAFAAFSFYPGKNLGAYGDGGALTSNDPALAARVAMMRNYGQRRKYEHAYLAWNRRLDTLQAAVLRVKLRHLDGWNSQRRQVAATYHWLLEASGLELPVPVSYAEHVYHLYVVQSPHRDTIRKALEEEGIASGIHYPLPIHLQQAYREMGRGPGSFPVSEQIAPRLLSLPMYPELTEEQVGRVAGAVLRAVSASVQT